MDGCDDDDDGVGDASDSVVDDYARAAVVVDPFEPVFDPV
jgi:hypothetical protein